MKETILVVDDLKLNREIIKSLFREKCTVLEAGNGQQALDIVKSDPEKIDVVILDLVMPVMSGLEVLEHRMKMKEFKDIPVVIITSSERLEDQLKAFELGANDFITKPFSLDVVMSRIENVLSSRRRIIAIEEEARKFKVKSELDQMTKLLNKTTCEDNINSILFQKPEALNAFFVIDIDNFKAVNDTLGHLTGDHIIKIVANVLSNLFRKSDIVGRIGGDEFIVFMEDVPDHAVIQSKANELVQIMKYKPNLSIPENITLSIGFCITQNEKINYKELLERADEALYQAKKQGKACFQEYGVEAEHFEKDDRPVALLISRDRGISCTISANVPQNVKLIPLENPQDCESLDQEVKDRVILIYADVTDDENRENIWGMLEYYPWIHKDQVIAVCQESNMEQLAEAVSNQVGDVITAPIDVPALKRRNIKRLRMSKNLK